MKEFIIDLDDFCEGIFDAMEAITEGGESHEVMVRAENKFEATKKIVQKLRPYVHDYLKEV